MRVLPFLLVLMITSCRWHGMDRPPLGGRGDGGVTQSGSTSLKDAALSQKTVTAKHEPATLIAFDGSKCLVTTSKFNETVVGTKVWCVWTGP